MQHFAREVIERLARAQVEFVVVGGVSAVLQGVPITTVDLDICYRRTPQNIGRLIAALAPFHPLPRDFPSGLPFTFDERTITFGTNFTLKIGDEDLDLLGEMSAIGGYEEVIGDAADIRLGQTEIKVLSLPHLIATKQAAGRPKDLAILPVLRATLQLRSGPTSLPDESPRNT